MAPARLVLSGGHREQTLVEFSEGTVEIQKKVYQLPFSFFTYECNYAGSESTI